jgi:hypothetical protein
MFLCGVFEQISPPEMAEEMGIKTLLKAFRLGLIVEGALQMR